VEKKREEGKGEKGEGFSPYSYFLSLFLESAVVAFGLRRIKREKERKKKTLPSHRYFVFLVCHFLQFEDPESRHGRRKRGRREGGEKKRKNVANASNTELMQVMLTRPSGKKGGKEEGGGKKKKEITELYPILHIAHVHPVSAKGPGCRHGSDW